MENLQQIFDRFLGFLRSLPDMIGGFWDSIGDNAAALGVLLTFLALLVGIAGLMGWRPRRRKTPVKRILPYSGRWSLARVKAMTTAAESIGDLSDEIDGTSPKPPIRARDSQDRRVRLSLGAAGESSLTLSCEIDGQPAAPEQIVSVGAGFAFSYVDWLRTRSQATKGNDSSELHKLGRTLGAVLFPDPINSALGQVLDEAAAAGSSIEFVIETDDPKLLGIPFEAASLPDGRIPALQAGLRMLRRYTPAKGEQKPQPGPLKILVAVGAPDEGKTASLVLDPERELQTILDAVERARRDGAVHVRILEVGSLGEIRKELRRQPYHVLYLSGHGGAGQIELETEDGGPARVDAGQIAEAIHDSGHASPLVYLAACHSGQGEAQGETETAGLAQGLLEKGVPLVLAMQTAVSDHYATELAGRFYGEISSATVSPSTALARARRDLERERNEAAARGEPVPPPEYATPSLFCAGQESPLLDLAAEPVPPQEYSRPITAGAVPMLGVGDLIGRRKEVRDVVRVLTGSPKSPHGRKAGYQLIGMGGVGKSSVAGRVMQRLSDQGWQVVAFSGRWELGRLCGAIGAALVAAGDELKPVAEALVMGNIQDEARVQMVAQLLGNHKFLLVLDNFEDNLTPGGKGFRNDFNRQAVEAFCQAARVGKLLITSRYPVPGMKGGSPAVTSARSHRRSRASWSCGSKRCDRKSRKAWPWYSASSAAIRACSNTWTRFSARERRVFRTLRTG